MYIIFKRNIECSFIIKLNIYIYKNFQATERNLVEETVIKNIYL